VRSTAALCLVALAFVAGCGGGDDRPDLRAQPPPETETTTSAPSATTAEEKVATPSSPTPASKPTRLGSEEGRRITTEATIAADAIRRWDEDVTVCVGPAGTRKDPGGTCTRAAWDRLFDQMYSVQYELLDLLDRIRSGGCHEDLASAVDAVHGFLAGATPLKVVWLDDQQRPPALFDLESIVDVARPVPARIRVATTTCKS
jgi:hypothetical protein